MKVKLSHNDTVLVSILYWAAICLKNKWWYHKMCDFICCHGPLNEPGWLCLIWPQKSQKTLLALLCHHDYTTGFVLQKRALTCTRLTQTSHSQRITVCEGEHSYASARLEVQVNVSLSQRINVKTKWLLRIHTMILVL